MKLHALGLCIALTALGPTGALAQAGPPALSSVVGAPFSGVSTQQGAKNFADGNRIDRGGSVRLYRDGQGRTRVERDLGGNGAVQITINDPVSGDRYELRPQSKTCIVFKGGSTRAVPLQSEAPGIFVMFARQLRGVQDPGWSQPVSLGEKSFDGVRAVGARRLYTIPIGEIGNEKPVLVTVEQWYAPELGLVIAKSGRSSLGGEFSNQVENIVKGEPDAALFTVPADYTRSEAGHTAAAE